MTETKEHSFILNPVGKYTPNMGAHNRLSHNGICRVFLLLRRIVLWNTRQSKILLPSGVGSMITTHPTSYVAAQQIYTEVRTGS